MRAPASSSRLACSPTVSGSTSTVTVMPVGATSSSLRVISVSVTLSPATVPAMLIVSLPSARASSVGVSVKSTCALPAPAAITMLRSATGA